MTNKVEADLMKTEAFLKEQGEDIARGVLAYLEEIGAEVKAPVNNPVSTSGSFKVRTKAVMNVRAGAGTQHKINTVAPIGVYTIVATSGSWGKLKSGSGWINISSKYATRL